MTLIVETLQKQPQAPVERVVYKGTALGLTKVAVRNMLLSIITLGIYRFWGKTRMRHYLWGKFQIDGTPFEYTGTGWELFKGFFLAMLVLSVYGGISQILSLMFDKSPIVLGGVFIITLLGYSVLGALAIMFSQRYRLSRTNWRGIRGGMQIEGKSFFIVCLKAGLLSLFTAGFAYPIASLMVRNHIWSHSRFGDQLFLSKAKVGGAWRPWILVYGGFLMIIGSLIWMLSYINFSNFSENRFQFDNFSSEKFGILNPFILFGLGYFLIIVGWVCYNVREQCQIINGLSLGGLSFRCELRSRNILGWLLVLGLSYIIAIIFLFVFFVFLEVGHVFLGGESLSSLVVMIVGVISFLLLPVLQMVLWTHPLMRGIAAKTTVIGELNFAEVGQNRDIRPTRGEGLLEALDIGG